LKTAIEFWVSNLSDDYIIGWANRGLFRRGSKLADRTPETTLEIHVDHIIGHLDSYHQRIDGPGFKHLHCDCPVLGVCHHLTGFLLALRNGLRTREKPYRTEEACEDHKGACPWLILDPEKREQMLGKAAIRRAHKMLIQGIPVQITEDDIGLTALIREKVSYTVRIPRISGLDGALCSCKADRCVHQAIAVLAACRDRGIFKLEDISWESINPDQKQVIEQVESWLRSFLAQGIGKIAKSHIEQGESLATLAKQVDMPKIASQLDGINQWLKDERARISHVNPDKLRFQVARITAHLNALETSPLPQPFLHLAGAHTRSYSIVHDLALIGVGAEAWESVTGYCGFTLYFYSSDRREWYRHSQTKPLAYAKENGWRPDEAFEQMRWCEGPPYRSISGCRILIERGWVSDDLRLSSRDGTRIREPVLLDEGDNLPIFSKFSSLAKAYVQFMSEASFLGDPFMPAIVTSYHYGKPAFDPFGQTWSQTITDREGYPLHLHLDTRPYAERAIKALEKLNLSGKTESLLFGMVSQYEGELTMRPISFSRGAPFGWEHLTMVQTSQ
jgi:hypothetical protein